MSDLLLRLRAALLLIAIIVSFSAVSQEPPAGLLMHLPLDGDVTVRGRAAVGAEVISSDPDRPQGSLTFVEGHHSNAVLLDGQNAMRIPFDLHPDIYPQLTVTMWVYGEKDHAGGYLFSLGALAGPRLQYAKPQLIAHAPRTVAKIRGQSDPGRWVFVAGVWDYMAGSVALYVDRHVKALGFEVSDNRNHNWGKQNVWIGAYDDLMGSMVSGVRVDDIRVYDRALSAEDLYGLMLGPPIEEQPRLGEPLAEPVDPGEPQLGDPPLPPEDETPREAPFETGSDPRPEDAMHRDHTDTDEESASLEDDELDKLRSRIGDDLNPGGDGAQDTVVDQVADDYEPGPTTDWEQVQRDAQPTVDEEELAELQRSEGANLNPGSDRLQEAVSEQIGTDEIPEPTDFETRRQGLEEDSESVSGQGRPGISGTLEVKPLEDGEMYVRIANGPARLTEWSGKSSASNQPLTVDLETSAIHTIEWYEKSDVPCKIEVLGYAPGTNQFGGPNIKRFGVNECHGSANDRSKKTVSLLSQGAAVTELEVFLTKSFLIDILRDQLKGIRIGGFRISPEGFLTTDGAEAVTKRENAADGYSRTTYCPDGFVATGLKVGFQSLKSSKSRSIAALALICREVDD